MKILERLGKIGIAFASFAIAAFFAVQFGAGGLWRGFEPALAVTGSGPTAKAPYDLTRLEAVNETLKLIRDKYVEPGRVKPKEMLLSALNYVQRDVAQVIVVNDDPNEVTVRVETAEKKFRIDNVQGPWDVSARLREVFAFLQKNLRGTEVDLREVEYAACNGMLHTLDPHSVFLSPEAYKEMNLSTSGHFGGLGIVISIRDQVLTVINPMPDTPAGRAGIKRHDRIVKINNESTLNMPLDDAVRRLRGDPGTKVTVWVTRDGEQGWQTPKPYELVREVIKVRSVESRPLETSGIGYVRIKNFQATTSTELDLALDDLRNKGSLKGLVLDLRGNPGGLLDQATRVADKFLADGVIVSTVGASEGRDEKKAKSPGTEPAYPIAVLVNGNSASASEIVAGALKNHDRAVIVGSTTFGKGSVQLVFPDVTPEKAALKLTIAQYLTPGDVSIQGVGVTPDIELDPMTVDELEMDLTIQKDGLRERDLSAHLTNGKALAGSKPREVVRYQLTSAEREEMRERGGETDDDFRVDFPIRFARDLAQRMPPGVARNAQIDAARDHIEKARKDELDKVAAELSKLGYDWSDAPEGAQGPAKSDLEVKIETDRANNEVTAGEPMSLSVTVKNNGKQPIYRLRASTESDSGYLDGKELVFGKIAPGQSKTAKAPLGWCDVEGRKIGTTKPRLANQKRVCKIPMDALSRSDGVKVKFEAAGGFEPPTAEVRPTIRALERPLFQYAYQIVDDRSGNGDGRIQRGEGVSMYLTVKNVGKGRSFETQANIANLSGEGLLLRAGRFDISNMNPGDVRKVVFTFDVQPELQDNEATLSLSVGDRDLREVATEKVKIPVGNPMTIPKASGTAKAGPQGATLFATADPNGLVFGKLRPGETMAITGKAGDIYKVDLGSSRFAFVSVGETTPGSGAPSVTPSFEDVYSKAPPTLDVSVAAMATRDDKVKITGAASDAERLLDLYVFVGSRKLYYKSNRDGADPKKATFEFDAPLRPGVNVITVVARENPDTTTRRTLVVRKDGTDGAILKTPKTDDPVAEWLGEAALPED
ncbi:MXAN_5808 family serine peptidase [Polyangium sp. 15x6]|uniref:MXAN_5808 family serine peptidase n=1 Tax=Polyangium sp. 15x6 TaxID=3042687 RepID=UPI00249A0821|nr:MXAN_5808 family serine peptidase [Polyangium sp. 15x6]MDI3283689.1 MXAN_5808 family serine peptidase [Polyangium sp. 15x6]